MHPQVEYAASVWSPWLARDEANSCIPFQHFLPNHQYFGNSYKNPLDSASLLAVVPRREQPHIVLLGILVYECNYGLERNLTNKWKAIEHCQKKQNVDHSQASVSKLQIQCGHEVDCPTQICVKETFLLEEYRHVSVSVFIIMLPRFKIFFFNPLSGKSIGIYFSLTFQEQDLSLVHMDAYLRSGAGNGEDSVGRHIIYIWLPHPAVHRNHSQYQVGQAQIIW